MTSSTVSNESVARQERGDPNKIDPYPAAVSNKHVDRQERGDPCSSEISNLCTSTPHRSESNGIVESAVRRVKEGTSAVLLQSGLVGRFHGLLFLSAKPSRSLV